MKKYLISIILVLVGIWIYLERPLQAKREPEWQEVPLDKVTVHFENAEKDLLTWRAVSELIRTFLEVGYLSIQINDFEYQYYCTHCEGIEYQGSGPLILDSKNIDPIHDWCERNKGKFAEISFGDSIAFQVVEEVVKILNSNEFKFSFETAQDSEGIKIDLLDGSPKVRETAKRNPLRDRVENHRRTINEAKEPNQKLQPSPLNAGDKVRAGGGAAAL
jgi:hypothetical protein